MRALQLDHPGSAEIVHRAGPVPGSDEVVIEVTGAGMCATDVRIYDGQFAPTSYPIVPGHEFAGRVAATGSEVAEPAVGDLVAADCTLTCGRCSCCRSGRYDLCPGLGGDR